MKDINPFHDQESDGYTDYPDTNTSTESVITGTYIHETHSAILVRVQMDIDTAKEVWLPFSQISRVARSKDSKEVKLTVKNWLLKAKGLVD